MSLLLIAEKVKNPGVNAQGQITATASVIFITDEGAAHQDNVPYALDPANPVGWANAVVQAARAQVQDTYQVLVPLANVHMDLVLPATSIPGVS